MAEAQIAVLIDYENVGLGSIQPLFDQLSDVGRIIVKRAYADWTSKGKLRDQVLELGIEPVHHFRSTGSGKNSSDIHLVVDAVELLYTSPVDTFVIVSADSDFVGLVSKLRASGKIVIGAGRQDVVSITLVKSCDRYIYLESSPTIAKIPQKPQAPQNHEIQTGALPGSEALLARAMEASTGDHDRVPGSKLHETMTRIDPGFSFQALGHRTFTQFLEAIPIIKVLRSRGQGDTQVEWRTTPSDPSVSHSQEQDGWDQGIHEAWSMRASQAGKSISGTWAAAEAAQVLGVHKLSASRYKTLQKLLDSSVLLSQSWSREGNTLLRR
jgi:uncharacterized protein (TIGR00288 family)